MSAVGTFFSQFFSLKFSSDFIGYVPPSKKTVANILDEREYRILDSASFLYIRIPKKTHYAANRRAATNGQSPSPSGGFTYVEIVRHLSVIPVSLHCQ